MRRGAATPGSTASHCRTARASPAVNALLSVRRRNALLVRHAAPAGWASAGCSPRVRGLLPLMPAGRAQPPHVAVGIRGKRRRVEVPIASGVQLQGERRALARQRAIRGDVPVDKARRRRCPSPAAGWAPATTRSARRVCSPLKPALSAVPPNLLARARAQRVGIELAVARRVKLREQIRPLEGERSLTVDPAVGRVALRSRTPRTPATDRAIMRRGVPRMAARGAPPPQLPPGARTDPCTDRARRSARGGVPRATRDAGRRATGNGEPPAHPFHAP